MTTTPLMGLVLPTDQGSFNVWDVILDTAFGLIDGHDHSTGKGAKVPSGGLNINADVSWSSGGVSRAITDLKAIDFTPSAASGMTSLAGALYIDSADNELYYRTMLGVNIKVTLGAGLNVAAFAGGIGGDYISASALLSYDAATLSYWLQQPGAPRPWARLRSGDVDIYETAASIVNRVRLKSPAALAASYDVTWPAAVPGSTSLVQMSSAGVLSANNTVANAVVFSGLVTGNAGVATTAITASGVITANAGVATTTVVASGVITANAGVASTTVVASGLISANAGVTAAVNQSFTVSGTGRYKHPSTELPIHIAAFQVDGAAGYVTFNQIGFITGFTGACTVQAWVPLPVGKRILTYQQFYNVNSTGAAITPKLRRMTIGTGTINNVAAGSADNTGAAVESQTLSGINHTVLSGEGYFIEVSVSTANHQVWGAIVTYDDP